MPPSNFAPRLADHVRACRVGEQLIFLDLNRSEYIGVGGPGLSAFAAALLDESTTMDTDRPEISNDWLARLRARHLLADDSIQRSRHQTTQPGEAMTSLQLDDDDAARVGWRDLARLWRAKLITSASIRRRSFGDIADQVAALRVRHAHRARLASIDALPAAVARYVHLRPLALTARDRCLHDSLTLIHFLAPLGLFPRWMIGVRVNPFAAHSWVQSEGVVLNDLAEHVRHYQPILAV